MLIEPQPDYPEFQKRPDDDFAVIAPRIAIYDGDRYYERKRIRASAEHEWKVLATFLLIIAVVVGVVEGCRRIGIFLWSVVS